VTGNLRILFWRVIDRLVEADAFAALTVATPLHLGYIFHEERPVVLRGI